MSKSALDTGGHLVPQRLPVPGALVEKLLQALFVAVGQPGGHRARAFALAIQQQAAQVDPAPLPSISPAQGGQHLCQKVVQALPAGRQLSCGHTELDAVDSTLVANLTL